MSAHLGRRRSKVEWHRYRGQAAATGSFGPFEETTDDNPRRDALDHFQGQLLFSAGDGDRLEARPERCARVGSIIKISSAVADIMFEQRPANMGAKAGMNQVKRAVVNEFGQFSIRATLIAPRVTITPIVPIRNSTARSGCVREGIPLARINTCDDVASRAVFVASDEGFMTGQTFHVTGRLTLRRNLTLQELGEGSEKASWPA